MTLRADFYVGTIFGTSRNAGSSSLEASCGDAGCSGGVVVVVALDFRALVPGARSVLGLSFRPGLTPYFTHIFNDSGSETPS